MKDGATAIPPKMGVCPKDPPKAPPSDKTVTPAQPPVDVVTSADTGKTSTVTLSQGSGPVAQGSFDPAQVDIFKGVRNQAAFPPQALGPQTTPAPDAAFSGKPAVGGTSTPNDGSPKAFVPPGLKAVGKDEYQFGSSPVRGSIQGLNVGKDVVKGNGHKVGRVQVGVSPIFKDGNYGATGGLSGSLP